MGLLVYIPGDNELGGLPRAAMLTLLLSAGAALLVYLVVVGRYDEMKTLQQWEMVLSPECARVYEEVSAQVLFERRVVGDIYDDAVRAREDGCEKAMLHSLNLGGRLAGECSGSLTGLLRNLATLSSQAEVIAPVAPLRAGGFRTTEISALVGLHRLGHHLLLTTRERLRLRITLLRCAARATAALLFRATWRAASVPEAEKHWRRIEAMRADLETLTDESLSTLRVVLGSLGAARRSEPARVKSRMA